MASFDPPDHVEAITFAFYAYENAIVAVAEAKNVAWSKNHYEKAKLARVLFDRKILATGVEDKLLRLNELRKDVAYEEPGPELQEVDLEDLATDLERFIEEVAAIVGQDEIER